jgi:hypothetical protein
MPRTYASEFPDFTAADIPAELLDATQWEDMSWHNEICPRFVTRDTVQSLGETCHICVWVERVNPADREDESLPRFSVCLVTSEDCDIPDAWANAESVDCDNIAQVFVAIAQFAAGTR